MTYGDFKDLERTTASDKVLRDKALNIAKNPKFDGYQRGLASIVYKFFDKKSASFTDKSVWGKGVNIEVKHNEQLAEELHKPTVRKLKKKVYSGFKNNIWGADLADMQLISKFDKGFSFLLCVIVIFSKYAWVFPLKDKRGVSIVDGFQKLLDDSKRKPSQIWIDKGSNFTIILLKNDWNIMILRFIRYIMKENLLLLKNVLDHYTLSINTWLQRWKMYISIN